MNVIFTFEGIERVEQAIRGLGESVADLILRGCDLIRQNCPVAA